MEIPLNRGMTALVDDADYPLIAGYRWHVSKTGYAARGIRLSPGGKRGMLWMHRVVLGLSHGDGVVVDHIDGNKLNNHRANLRICSVKENSRNRGKQRNNKSGFKGVSKYRDSWVATIRKDGKSIYLGLHKTPEEAHEIYCLAADMLHGDFANHGTDSSLEPSACSTKPNRSVSPSASELSQHG
jgi:hypothetical protein